MPCSHYLTSYLKIYIIIHINILTFYKIKTNIPITLDPVGVGVSKLRNNTTIDLIKNYNISAIRGNITEIKTADGKLYVSAIVDCYNLTVLGLAMNTNMKTTLCEQTLENAVKAYPQFRGAIIHSDLGAQYTSNLYRNAVRKYNIRQSMNSAGGRCHDNARRESVWARFKEELLYGRYNTTKLTIEQLKTIGLVLFYQLLD